MLRQEAGWTNPRVLTILAIIFLFGIAVGSTVTRQYLHHRIRSELAIEAAQSYGLERMHVQLGLSQEQVKAVGHELDEYAKYYQTIEEEREDVAEHGKQRILSVLNTDQKKRFYDMFAKARP